MENVRRGKQSLTGFVAYMKRKDAETAVSELDGAEWGGAKLKVGFSKPVPIPQRAVYGELFRTLLPKAYVRSGQRQGGFEEAVQVSLTGAQGPTSFTVALAWRSPSWWFTRTCEEWISISSETAPEGLVRFSFVLFPLAFAPAGEAYGKGEMAVQGPGRAGQVHPGRCGQGEGAWPGLRGHVAGSRALESEVCLLLRRQGGLSPVSA